MKVVFIGRDNSFNRKYVNELFKNHELTSCLFVEIDRFSFKGRLKKIRRRMRRRGFFTVLDELAFQFYSSYFLRKEKELLLSKPDYFINNTELSCETHDVANVHSEKWIQFIKDQKPDIIFSICCNVIFKKELLDIPRLGTYILHEGITPEYKGLHTPIWALMNNEPDGLGYSLIKANHEIDGGEILDQGGYQLKENEGIRTWSWVGHNALIEGMPNIEKALDKLAKDGDFTPISETERKDQYYSWVRLSTFLKSRSKRKKAK